MTCALGWVAGPDAERPAAPFGYIVRVDRDTCRAIERRAKAAGMSPDRFVTKLVVTALAGPAPAADKRPTLAGATLAAFAQRHRLTISQAEVFEVLERLAVDGVAAPRIQDVADRVGMTGWTVNKALAALEAAGLIEQLPRPGRTRQFQIKGEIA